MNNTHPVFWPQFTINNLKYVTETPRWAWALACDVDGIHTIEEQDLLDAVWRRQGGCWLTLQHSTTNAKSLKSPSASSADFQDQSSIGWVPGLAD
jgi:hypothetical protein